MTGTIHAFDFLAVPTVERPPPVVAAFGDEPFLKRLVLSELRKRVIGIEDDVPVATYDADDRPPD
jgi:hypothetical protein